MADSIPDLWTSGEDARRLYSFYLSRLAIGQQWERIVTACREIRRHASRGPGLAKSIFTFRDEIDALCKLKDYDTAWRQLLALRRAVRGIQQGINIEDRKRMEAEERGTCVASLLYFRGRYRRGCGLKERYFDLCFQNGPVQSYQLLFEVYNDDVEPTHRVRVTLAHFYNRLGRDLRQWRHWPTFVEGFQPRLFRLAGIQREKLLADAGHLPAFFNNLMDIRDERTTSGVGGGVSDLLDSPAKVKKRQDARQQKISDALERLNDSRTELNQKLAMYFPELNE